MAYTIPETIKDGSTSGERVLFKVFKDSLPDDYIVYYEPWIDKNKADYVIIAPDLGIIVLEVKDYTEKTLVELSASNWRIYGSKNTIETVKNPLDQARGYAFKIESKLKKVKELVNNEGKYVGRLKFPYTYGVVFTRMETGHLARQGIYDLMPSNLVIGRDEIDGEDVLSGSINEKLINMFSFNFGYKMSQEEIDGIRYVLYPEVRIGGAKYNEDTLLSLPNLKAMDLYQESLAKQIGEGHRLIRGVSGSGKTIILSSRAKLLHEQNPDWKILIVCYGIPLSRDIKGYVSQMFDELPSNVEIVSFHEWLLQKFGIYDDAYVEGIFSTSISRIPVYDAILIDEGQDMDSSWLALLAGCLNRETGSFLIVEDRAQNIFKRKTSLSKDTGLDFRGRSRILSKNYRNTKQVLSLAWEFYKNFQETKVSKTLSDEVEIIPPQSSTRSGSVPVVKSFGSFNDEACWISEKIKELLQDGVSSDDIVILYRVKQDRRVKYTDVLFSRFDKMGIPYYWITKNQNSKKQFKTETGKVSVSTIASAKGLSFKYVFIMNFENLPFALSDDRQSEVSLAYIAMTRSTEHLFISYSGKSEFTEWFEEKKPKTMNMF